MTVLYSYYWWWYQNDPNSIGTNHLSTAKNHQAIPSNSESTCKWLNMVDSHKRLDPIENLSAALYEKNLELLNLRGIKSIYWTLRLKINKYHNQQKGDHECPQLVMCRVLRKNKSSVVSNETVKSACENSTNKLSKRLLVHQVSHHVSSPILLSKRSVTGSLYRCFPQK